MLTIFVSDDQNQIRISVSQGTGRRVEVGVPRQMPEFHGTEDLRFYLEEYLDHPVGGFADRGQRLAEHTIPEWSRHFAKVLFDDAGPLSALLADIVARLRVGEEVTLAIESTRPEFHALPWELVIRGLSTNYHLNAEPLAVVRALRDFQPGEEVLCGRRMLIVIARPLGRSDVEHQIIADQILRWNGERKTPLMVDVVRPPTFTQFEALLRDALADGCPYHIVHFDGHGDFDDACGGQIFFENENGGVAPIFAGRFADALAAGGTKLVLLNACRSAAAAETSVVASNVATAVMARGGVNAVVAMTHNVSVRAAELFVSGFYDAFLSGKPVTACVASGRRQLHDNTNRPSIVGPHPLQDWMVPVLYADVSLIIDAKIVASVDGQVDRMATGKQPLVGRDDGFLELERMMRQSVIVHLHGTAGIGKTALAIAFADWIKQTGGLGEERAGVNGWIRLDTWPPVLRADTPERPIVILDNVDHVTALSDAEIAKAFVTDLLEFVRIVVGKEGRTILVTRSHLPWLSVSSLSVRGIPAHSAAALFSTFPIPLTESSSDIDERFGLGRQLAGHPGAILSVWPKLQQHNANRIRSALGGQGSLDGISLDGRALGAIWSTTSLLRAELRPYLTIVALSLGVSDALTLKICLMSIGATQSLEEAHKWALELLEAVGAGGAGAPATKFPVPGATDLDLFLHPMRLHPQMALGFVDQRGPKGENPVAWRDIVYEALAHTHVFMSQSIARDIEVNSYRQMIFDAQELQRDAYVRSLVWHFDRGHFDAVAFLIGSLARVDREVGNNEAFAKYWSERLLEKLGSNWSTMSHDRLRSWLLTYSNEAIRRLRSGEVDEAESMFETARSLMERAPANNAVSLALCYRMLGQANAMRKKQSDAEKALGWFGKAIELDRAHDAPAELACALHDRAMVLNGLLRLDEAEVDALEAVELRWKLNDRRQLAQTYRLLASICHQPDRFAEAEQYSNLAEIAAGLANDPVIEGQAIMDLAAASLMMGPNVHDHLTKAIECFVRGKADEKLVNAYLEMSKLEQRESDFAAAEHWMRHAADIADKIGLVNLDQQVAMEMMLMRNREIHERDSAEKPTPTED